MRVRDLGAIVFIINGLLATCIVTSSNAAERQADEAALRRRTAGFVDAVVGAPIVGVRRAGKVVVLDGPDIGLYFGMTGRIVVDGTAPIDRLQYASGRDEPEWDRLRLFTDDRRVAALRFNDPRRLGRVSIDPDLSGLGVDFTAVTPRRLTAAIGRRDAPVKSVLLDQHAVAGLDLHLLQHARARFHSVTDSKQKAHSTKCPIRHRLVHGVLLVYNRP